MITNLYKIETEIQVVNKAIEEDEELLSSQKKYLKDKLEDLIHSYLLECERTGFLTKPMNDNLKRCDYTAESNIGIILN